MSLLARLIESGAPADVIEEVAILIAEKKMLDQQREKAAARQANKRKRDKGQESVTQCHVTSRDVTTKNTLDKSFPQTPFKINPKKCPPIVPPFCDNFVGVWNEVAAPAGMTKAMPLNAQRKAKLKRRVSEFGEDGMLAAVRKLAASPFHCGENDRNWKADIGWLLKSSENVTKALELEAAKPANDSGSFLGQLQRKSGP